MVQLRYHVRYHLGGMTPSIRTASNDADVQFPLDLQEQFRFCYLSQL